jgi:hypothetical protein
MSRYAVERYQPGFLDSICRLEAPFWGSSRERAREFFRWKYVDHPYTPEPLFYLALCDGRVVGGRGMFGTCWESESGTRHLFPAPSDFIIVPDHRDGGLYRELNELPMHDLAERGYTHAVNLSATPANYVALVMSFGWKSIGSAGLVALTEPGRATFKSLRAMAGRVPGLKRIVEAERAALSDLGVDEFTGLDRKSKHPEPPIVVERRPRIEAMVELARRLRSTDRSRRLRHVEDAEYYTWRFGNPLASYRFLYRETGTAGDRIDGWLILQEPRGQNEVNIVDWRGIDLATRARLLETALEWGEFRKISTWTASLPEEDAELLRETGFEPEAEAKHGGGGSVERTARLLVRPVADSAGVNAWALDGRALHDLETWDLRMICSDRY